MSTTNTGGGAPNPGAGSTHGAHDDHGGPTGANPASIQVGHEPDAFAVKPILSIPLAVVITFVIAFAVAAAVFVYVMLPTSDPFAHPAATARNNAPLNDRLARIDRTGDTKDENRDTDQPRLEPLRRLENNGQTTTQHPLPNGNSPEIHPEDIRPDRVPGLQQSAWVDGKKFARLPIADVLKLADTNKDVMKNVAPVREHPVRLLKSESLPSVASAGRGRMPGEAQKKDEKHKDH